MVCGDQPTLRTFDAILHPLVRPVAVAGQVLFIVAEPEPRILPRLGPCPRRIFPFRLGQKPVALAGRLRKPVHISLRIIPAQADRRRRARLWQPRIAPRALRMFLPLAALERDAFRSRIVVGRCGPGDQAAGSSADKGGFARSNPPSAGGSSLERRTEW